MNLLYMCIQTLAKPDVIMYYKSELHHLPASVKNKILYLLCKRGYVSGDLFLSPLFNGFTTDLDFSECIVTDELLKNIEVCSRLRNLDLSLRRRQERNITKEALCSLFGKLQHLEILALPHCKQLDDDVIDIISNNSVSLQELHIPNTSISDRALQLLGENLKCLRVVNFLGTKVSDSGLAALIKGNIAETLAEINIDKCNNVTIASGILIDKRCPNIKIFTCGFNAESEETATSMNRIRSKVKQIFWSV